MAGIHETVELRAAEAPEALAVVAAEGAALTYRELNERANRLAHYLRRMGVGPEVPVGVLARRSPDAVVASLAVLKAGGCYLPMDPAYPDDRLIYTLEDSGTRILLTQAGLVADRPGVAAACPVVIRLDADAELFAGESPENPEPWATLGNLAYVIYTSGSTGRPKGVEVPHRGLANLVAWHREAFGVKRADRATRIAGSAFDASVWEVWANLAAGASLHIPDDDLLLAPARLLAWMAERGITFSFLPTPLAEALLEEPWPQGAPLRALTVGGDRLHRGPREDHPFGLFNLYGPTENSVVTTWGEVAREGKGNGQLPTIGRAISGVWVHLVDPDFLEAETGELLTGGAGLARGYRGRPDLTAERFVPDPFSEVPGARLYRTGDLVRALPSGEIDFIGRIDSQVKVRGFRIELGEIEAVLRRQPGVRDGVVLAWDEGASGKRLAGYVVAQEGVTAEELRAALGRELPEYMVPAAWTFLDALPVTPNGKVDRRALPAPEPGEETYVAPRTPAEEAVAEIFAEVLGLPRVGALDDFFALGGHSLTATRVISRVRSRLGTELPQRALFDSPTVAALAGAVAASAAEEGSGEGWEIPLAPRPEGESFELPVSFPQRRLWLAHLWSTEAALYNTPFALGLEGPMDVPALARSLAEIVARHESLRTTFRAVDGEPVQVIARSLDLPLPVADLASLPEPLRAVEAERILVAEARRPFDLERGPVIRVGLLRLGPEEHVLLALMHHIVSDDWSIWIFASELAALYAAFSQGQPSPLPALPIQYGDFAAWQRRWLDGPVLERQLGWWRERLQAPLPVIDLPADRPRPPLQTFAGARLRRVVPRDLLDALRALGRREGESSLFMVLLAAYGTLVHRYTGSPDVLVGSPIANRKRVEVEGLIGFFVNTLALRSDLSGDPDFRELLGRVREMLLGVYGCQEVPFERLVEDLAPSRDLSRNLLLDVFLILGNAPRPPGELAPGVRLRLRELPVGIAKVDLSLFLEEGEDGLAGIWEHNTALFDTATAERMAGHWEALLAGLAVAPETRLSELPLLTGEERRQVLGEFRGTGQVEAGRPVHELFGEWVRRTPEAPAVVFEGESLSYGELDLLSNRLARRLRGLGVGPEVRVGIRLDRSLSMIAAILGVLKAGGAYVPLDPEFPAERLDFMLADSGARVLVTEEELAAAAGESGEPLAPGTVPESLAYVIYTSGSTGRPKGVMVEHRQLASYVAGVVERMELPPGASYATVSTIAADLGNTVVFASLATGGVLHVIARERLTDPERMAELLERHPVDCLKIVPSHLLALLAGDRPERVLPRRLVVVGGEASQWSMVDRIRSLAPGCRVLNHYGPTETTIGVLALPTWLEGEAARRGPTVPLGRPLGGTRVLLADARLQPVPVGVPGELLAGGPQVTRGYLGRPDLTAERFIPDPQGAGERLYRTGDLARYLPDGRVEFLGRIDHQVKIRGFRVEPGEVEAALLAHPAVREALVLARVSPGGEPRLVGYVVPRAETPGLSTDLRAFLRERLPEALVPGAFVVLSALPLTANGKVDRRALPDPEMERAEAPVESTAPRTAVQELLGDLFAEVLALDRVGLHDDFFDLGGHSLLATRVIARVRRVFGVEIELRAVFEQRTVAALATRIEAKLRGDQGAEAPPLKPEVRPAEGSPLSFSQESLWVIEQLAPGSTAYHVPRLFHLRGDLRVDALSAALSEIERRHEALRTVFDTVAEMPVQRVLPAVPRPLGMADLSGLPETARRAEAARLAAEEAGRPFDLRRGPLVRTALLRLGAGEHTLLHTTHHIVSDGWSFGVLLGELAALYGAISEGRPSPLPELRLQYADYAAWQRRWLTDEVLAERIAWWREHLEGRPEGLDLPGDRPRPAVRSGRGAVLPVSIPGPVAEGLERLGRQHGATLFVTVAAAFQTLLHRFTGGEDLLVGTSAAGRDRTELFGLIGFFVNTLVLRGDLAGDPSFVELLSRVREAALGAFAHQDLPFEKLVEALAPRRDLGRNPLFEVLFSLDRSPAAEPELGPGLSLVLEESPLGSAKLDLTLALARTGEGILGVAEYATDLFDAATVERFLAGFGTLLGGIAADPRARLSDLPLLTAEERAELAFRSAGPERSFPAAVPLQELFEAQARRTPDALAVIAEDEGLTYRDLDLRANRLAWHLRAHGVGPESRVGLCLERSAGMVVALLATLKAGGAYVPLDPEYPAERLAFLLANAGVHILLAQERTAASLPEHGARVIFVETGAFAQGEEGSAPPPRLHEGGEALAYVIYTSGSTGQPKGAMIPHRAIVNHMLWMAEELPLVPGDRVLQKTPFGFDASVWEFWAPLAAGAALVMARPGGHRDTAYLVRAIAEHGVTVLQAVPSLLLALFEEEDVSRCRTLRRICAGGEALTPEVMAAFFAGPLAARAELVNLYGPTETAIDVTFWRAEPERGERPALLGGPIANARIHVLGPRLELAPVGIPGELCVGGPPVGRGYLGRPEETAARFIPDPWGEPGARLYRTGDLGRLLPEGHFESLGRIDHQVKIRGLRIEPGEIEAALAELPGVRQAVVLVSGDRLAAFVVPRGEAPTADALRAALAERLPAHMIPMEWAFLDALPWTPNGKVDRKALAKKVPRAGVPREEGSAPRTPEEGILAGLFARLLGVERVPVDAGFFDLGGNSLLAIRLAGRIRRALGVELSLRQVFEEPTVAGLARLIERLKAASPASPVSADREGRIPLSFAQQRLWFLEELQPGLALYNMPALFRIQGALDAWALEGALSEIVRRHEVLRTVYQVTDGQPEQVILPFSPCLLPVTDLSGLAPEAARAEGERLAGAWGGRPFDLERGPVFRPLLVRMGAGEHELHLALHHIASDGWSSAVLAQELKALYGAFVAGLPSPLPPLPLQYADYAIWQRRWLSGPVLEEQTAFWRERLAAHPEALELPADRPRPAVPSGRGSYAVRTFPAPLANALDRFARAAGATPFMASLAAFGALLGRYGRQDDLVVGTPVANRGRLDVEGLIGCFVNVLALRIDLSGDPGAGELLARVRDAALAAYSHQDVPFEKLVEELVPERDLSRPPLFQVTFGYEEDRGRRLSLGSGILLEAVENHTGTSKFDLSVQAVRTADGLAVYAEYATDLFEAGTIERLLECFGLLLAGIAARPQARLSELPLLAPAERERILAWNREMRNLRTAPADVTLDRLFAAQAERSPGAVAVVDGGESLTYAELALRVRRLAARLRSAGVGPEVAVGVCLGRSAGLLVSVLAVLEAGGVYVPLDPAYPAERLALMVEDAGCAALIVQGEPPAGLAGTGARVLRLDAPGEEPAAVPAASGPSPDNLAYVIYTSGSTGRPKGVGVAHREVVAHCLSVIERFELTAGDRMLLFVSPSFDVAIEEMLPPLLCGAAVVVRGSELWDTADLGDRIARLGLSVVNLPTAYWKSWVHDAGALAAAPPSLRLVIVGGEAMPAESARLWHETPLREIPLLNGYGPTEAVITPTYLEVAPGAWESAASVPIGRPLPGRSAWVLDRHGNPQPLGVPGELFLGGLLARGYLRHPGLTAERFVPDPFADEAGARLYRTGDLARLRPDGILEFLGRVDAQVKIRGFRIEPGEVEEALRRSPGVADAAVVVSRETSGEPCLVACAVPAEGGAGELLAAGLRAALAARLPAYMVPSRLLVVPALPLTPNGKVDRRALARMAPAAEAGPDTETGPRTPVEETLAGIWTALLGVAAVGRQDDFFHLGGHSLIATRLVSRVRKTFGVEIELRAVFEAPTLAGLASRIEAARAASHPTLAPEPRTGPVPASSAQRRLWFLDRLLPGSAVYNIPSLFRMSGPLRPDVLAAALEEIVRRHEALRTVFAAVDGEPVQVVRPFTPGGVPEVLPVVDLRALPEPLRQDEARLLTAREARRPFDLARGPLLRTRLVVLGGDEHELGVDLHHIISDGWSGGVLARELSALYAAFAAGEPSPLPELPVQYADFALWEQRWVTGVLDAQLAWWRERLADLPGLDLPADRPRPATPSYRGAAEETALPDDLLDGLEHLSHAHGTTLFMTLLAAFESLLGRWSGQEDFAVGTPVAGRNRAEVEGLIGFFVNTLTLRASLGGDPSTRDLLGRVREEALAAFAHQDVSFERLVEALSPERDLSRNPFFQVALALEEFGDETPDLGPGLAVRFEPVDAGTTKLDLALGVGRSDDGLAAGIVYATDLFDRATVQRLLGHLSVLLSGMVESPEARLSDLPLLTEAERLELLSWHEETDRLHPESELLHGLFEDQADRTPEAVALIAGTARLTYAELRQRSGALAARLAALGVGPETAVGLCLGRTEDLVIAMLATLRAGGFYVPLDPAYPSDRLAFMLEDSGARVVLAHAAHLDRLPPHDAEVIVLDREDVSGGDAGPVPVTSGNLAYLIYTSGSTGRPKAVAIEHRSAVLLALWARGVFTPDELAGVLASTSITFDLSVFEIFVPLAWGGTVILADNALALPRLPAKSEVTLVNTVPSAMAELLRMDALPASLVTVNLAGEALPRALADRIYERPGIERLYNLYGPSEDTTYSTFALIERVSERPPAIGRPIDRTEAHVLDRRFRPLPVGVPGELCLGGDSLARGYLGRPELTAQRFVPDPWSGRTGARLYRTGDLARRRPDGSLDFLGRIDHQVKVRGFRIELGEIESALLATPGIEAAVVVAREDTPGDRRLAAYVVGEGASAESLRRSLGERVPEPMVPSVFVFLDALPLTPNGKVDRKRLPAPGAPQGDPGKAWVEPRTPLEQRVAEVWAEVLGVDRVGLHDSFWSLGGHSLLAIRVLSRLQKELGIDLPVRALFESSRLEDLVRLVAEALRAQGGEAAVLLPPTAGEEGGAPALSFGQERLWFLDRLEPGSPLYNMPSSYRLEGPLRPAALAAALAEIVRRHAVLRTVFRAVDGKPVPVIRPAAFPALPLADLAGLPEPAREAEAARLHAEEQARPFDLEAGPLFRATLVRLAAEEHSLFLSAHHIVSDGWSVGVLMRELTALYPAALSGSASPLPPLPLQYADHARWQRRWLAGEVLAAQLSWWRERLGGQPASLELPTDRPRPAVRSSRGASERATLPASLADTLERLGHRSGATLFMTLLAVWNTLLLRVTGQEDVSVGTPVANRGRAEVEGLIGFFVNTLVLRTDLAGDPPFTGLLARVREVALGAYSHQDLPFDRLVAELSPGRDLSRTPLFQVLFAVHHLDGGKAELAPGLIARGQGEPGTTAKFDLSLHLGRAPGELIESIEYSTDLWDAATIRRLLGHFEVLLCGVAADPEARLSELPLLSGSERSQILTEWAGTATDYPREATIHGLFSEQARRTPDAVAVVFGEERLTYAELDARADRLARRLRALGVAPEVAVGLCAERSPDLIVAILGILKAGGAYVPLDPAYPAERLAFMLADVGAPVVVVQERLLGSLPETGARRVVLEELGEGEGSALPAVDALNLAYAMFTSGSTGRPKGVAVTHRNVVRLVRETGYARFGPEEVFLQLAPVSFDASTLEIWGALLSGGRLAIFPPVPPSLAELGRAIERHGVTTLWLTAGLFHQMVEENLAGLSPVRQLLAGGDVLSPAHVRRALEALPGTTLVNGYGPTENTTFTCCFPMTDPEQVGATVPIGRPIANTRVFLLDRDLRPVPAGVPGRLYAGGDGLARGYASRPDLTAERFVPDPVSGEPGARLYATGDLARWRPDGAVEFLGRADHQVKVRGFRIELGEIEAALSSCPDVSGAAVLVREDVPGDKRLVAYVVPREGAALAERDLRAALEKRLPSYMVPARFVSLPELPLTPNGKVDRRALPAPDREMEAAAELVPPRTPFEEALAGIWQSLLGLDRVGVHDDFFLLGGHSLLATQMVSRVRGLFGVEIGLRSVFEATTLEKLAAHIEEAGRRERGISAPSIRPAAPAALPPLSFSQQRLWFLDRLQPGTAVYNVPGVFRIGGELSVPVLEAVLAEIVRRHAALRTLFAVTDGEPVQLVTPPELRPLPEADLSGLPAPAREAESLRLAEHEARRPFDLSRGPLIRWTLVRLERDDFRLLLTLHHIVSDGWSVGVLVREMAALYGAFSVGRPSPLPELPVQYADFSIWQRGWLTGEVLEAQLAFWRDRLAGAPAALDLPTDRPRPAVQSFRGAAEPLLWPPSLVRAVEGVSRRRGATVFMTLLAAFDVLLVRYTGQEDLVVGSPIANRNRAETEGLIGFFVNTLALRTDAAGDPSFGDLLAHVREATLSAYAHQDLPFERLVEELAPERDLSRSPLFQVSFMLQNAPMPFVFGSGLTMTVEPVETGVSKFDLTLGLQQIPEGIAGSVEYATDLFDAATIRRLLGHFEVLLSGIAADPEARLSELPLLSGSELAQTLAEWSGTATDYPREATIHGLFAEQARRTPHAVALVFAEERLTYAELDTRSEGLARRLRVLGVGPEVAVGLCVERSPDLIVAILGILKAGGAYVPLDPAYPAERLALMLEDVGAPVVVAQERLLEALPETGVLRVALEDLGEGGGEGAPLPRVDALSLAYVMFTSGSTGRPKGVAVTHRNVVRLVRETNYVRFGPEEAFLQLAPVSFDASTLEIWGALLHGGRLVVFPPGPPSLAGLGRTVERHGVTTLWLTAGLFHQMVEENLAGLSPVRQLLAGGDVLSPAHVRRALEGLPGTTLVNGYGPTENTTFTCCFPMTDLEHVGVTVPIGRPIANTRVFLLDRDLRPVPVGIPGRLYAGGEGLARGYVSRPDLTAERFVPDPVSGEPGARLYNTGDLARWRPDGAIEFLGRADHQVKVRGFRIEPGEIETALSSFPEVSGAAVLVREDVPGDKRLVAYVVAGEGAALAEQDLRAGLERRLPSYMVPARFVFLPELPLTPNGKVDRRALPAPDRRREESAELVAPQTPFEEALAGIWQSLLGLDRVGSHDDFFRLGGHSLLATRMVSRIREVFGVEVELRAVFESPTLAGLAARIEESGRWERGLAAPPIRPSSRDALLPLSFAQQRLWFLDRLQPGSASYNVPAALRIHGPLAVSALEAALAEIVRRHEALRTAFAVVDGEPVQLVVLSEPLPLPVVDLADLPEPAREAESARLSREEAMRPFELSRAPLVRSALLRLGTDDHRLLLSLHHIVSDGWSIGVLLRELSALYRAFSSGRPSPLPELAVQYADFTLWQRQWLSGETLAMELAWWRKHLAGAPAALDLPTDRPRPAVRGSHGSFESFAFGEALTAEIRAVSRQSGATVFMTLLAAFGALLSRYTGEEDLVVGTPIANRNRAEIEDLIGFFVNTLVLRTDASGDPSFAALLGRVREATLAAYEHQDLPFEKLVEELAPERDLSRSPLFQVSFMLQNAPMPPLELGPGLTLAGEEVELEAAKFDLTLALAEDQGGLVGTAGYSTDLFESETVRRMTGHFRALLEGIVENPGERLSDLPLLTAAERRQLASWHEETRREHPAGGLLHGLFEAQAARTPDAVALIAGTVRLTYADLDRRSTALAGRLTALGVGPETAVGLCLGRTEDLVIAMMATLKAGGFYVPLDPAYPSDRLAFMLEDSRARVVLAHAAHLDRLPPHGAEVIVLDDAAAAGAQQAAPLHAPGSGNLAYLIYTSGSTGRPKAVAIEHRSAVLLAHWARGVFSPAELFGVLASTSITFDLSVFEIFVPLAWGGTVILAENALALPRLPARDEVTLINTVPSAIAELLRMDALPSSLATVNLAGEALTRALSDRVYGRPETARLYNLYGPSEDTTYSTFALIERAPDAAPSIGRPIDNTEAHIVDRRFGLLPVGVPGELCLGGESLARGYLGRPELTAEKFVPDPWSGRPGARLYRTGDLVRRRPDGSLDFLGRIDHQVKVRGFRIELGEIESALLSAEGVEAAVAVVREDVPGDQRIVAYVVKAGEAATAAALREALGDRLPEYMVPSLFVFLEALPLTPNGKVDRKRLPVPELSRLELEDAFVAPRTALEVEVANIWADVLGVDQVGLRDSFWSLGGHSLLATKVLSRLGDTLGMDLPLHTLFEAPTVEGLTTVLGQKILAEQGDDLLAELDSLSEEEIRA